MNVFRDKNELFFENYSVAPKNLLEHLYPLNGKTIGEFKFRDLIQWLSKVCRYYWDRSGCYSISMLIIYHGQNHFATLRPKLLAN